MPGVIAAHLGSMIGNHHPVEMPGLELLQDPQHIYIAFVDKDLPIGGGLAFYIPEMNMGDVTGIMFKKFTGKVLREYRKFLF
jgi:hypothetical protein